MNVDIISEIKTLLKGLSLNEADYRKKSTDPGSAHGKIIEKLKEYWFDKYPYIEKYGLQNIDFLGKEAQPEGHILVAVEVDAGWWRAIGSCVKLANIRAKNKIWIYVTAEENAEENFKRALKDIQKLLKMRNETKESFGNFVAFLKTPKGLKMQRIL